MEINMKKTLFVLSCVLILLGIIFLGFLVSEKTGVKILGSNSPTPLTNNPIDSVKGYSTSTQSYCLKCPVKVLDKAPSRQFAYITTDSVKPIYLFFPSGSLNYDFTENTHAAETFTNRYATTSAIFTGLATSTITDLTQGLKIVASSTPFKIDLSNQINSEIWATSTPEAGTQVINIMYVQ
jgi:hypothetical protein